jgi:hypothetical protein
MAKLTKKNCQQHLQCVCGHNSVEHDVWRLPQRTLFKLGYKRKKDKRDGSLFFFRYALTTQCPGIHNDY